MHFAPPSKHSSAYPASLTDDYRVVMGTVHSIWSVLSSIVRLSGSDPLILGQLRRLLVRHEHLLATYRAFSYVARFWITLRHCL